MVDGIILGTASILWAYYTYWIIKGWPRSGWLLVGDSALCVFIFTMLCIGFARWLY